MEFNFISCAMTPLCHGFVLTAVLPLVVAQPIDYFALPYQQQVAERDRLLTLPDGADRIVGLLASGNGSGTDGGMLLTNGLVKLGPKASSSVLQLLKRPDAKFGYWMNSWAASLPKDEADRVARLLATDPRITSTIVSGMGTCYLLRQDSPALDVALNHIKTWPPERRGSLYAPTGGDPRLTALGVDLILSEDRPGQLEGLGLLAGARNPNPALEARLLVLLKKQIHPLPQGRLQALDGFGIAAHAYAVHAADPAAAFDLLREYIVHEECAASLTPAMHALGLRGVDVADTLTKMAPQNEDYHMGYNRAVAASKTRDGQWEARLVKQLADRPAAERPALAPFISELKSAGSRAEAAALLEETLAADLDDKTFCRTAAVLLGLDAPLQPRSLGVIATRSAALIKGRLPEMDWVLTALEQRKPPTQLVPLLEKLINEKDDYLFGRAIRILAGSDLATRAVIARLDEAVAVAPTAQPLSEGERAVFSAADLTWRYLYALRQQPTIPAEITDAAAKLALLTPTPLRDEGLGNLRSAVATRCANDQVVRERTLRSCRADDNALAKLLSAYLEAGHGQPESLAATPSDYRAALASPWLADPERREHRERLLYSMVRIGMAEPEAIDRLKKDLYAPASTAGPYRDLAFVARLLARLSPPPAGFEGEVRAMLVDERPRIRLAGLAAAAEMPAVACEAVPRVLDMMEGPTVYGEPAAIVRVLAASGDSSPRVTEALKLMSISSDTVVARAASDALRQLESGR